MSSLVRTLVIGSTIGAFALMLCLDVWAQHGWTVGMGGMSDHNGYLLGTTIVFAGIVAGQLGTMIVVRSSFGRRSGKKVEPNRWLLCAVLIEIALLLCMVYVPILQTVLGTVAIPLESWAMLYAVVPFVIMLELFRRLIGKKIRQAQGRKDISEPHKKVS
jgi:magnesium-transporting ATPase (P-type)